MKQQTETASPVVPAFVRTIAYWAVLLAGGLQVYGAALLPEPWLTRVTALCGLVAVVGGGLGVAYRPTKPSGVPPGGDITYDD